MGLLDGDLATSIYEGFKDRLLTGEVRRKEAATSAGLDDHGDPIDLDTPTWDVQGFYDVYSRDTRARAGIPDTAVKVCIFAQSAPDYNPHQDDLVRLGTRWARLTAGPIEIDPAGALWTCQGQEVGAPQ
jgi:hypothetical protein